MNKSVLIAGMLGLAALPFASPLSAQEAAWPDGPVTVVVPYSPGGGTDLGARLMSDAFAETIGEPIVVENRPGAGNTIGATYVSQADPDGQTLLMTSSSYVIAPHLFANLKLNALEDLTPVVQVTAFRHAVLTGPESPYQTIEDLFAAMEENPGQLTYSSSGIGSAGHLAIAEMLSTAGLEARHIPYDGGGAARQATTSGEVDFMLESVGPAFAQIQEGTLVALALQTTDRIDELPDVPTLNESVLPGFQNGGWLGIFVPSGTPQETIDAISDAVNQTLSSPEMAERYSQAGLALNVTNPGDFQTLVRSDYDRIGNLIETAGITPQ